MPTRAPTHRPPGHRPAEKRQLENDPRRTNRWNRKSRSHRQTNPLCSDPFGDHGETPAPARHTHHIIAVEDRPDLCFVDSNLASVCIDCHAKLNAMERAHKPTAHLFQT